MSAETATEAVKGTFELLKGIHDPSLAIIFLFCIAIAVVCILAMGGMWWAGRQDKKDAETRYDTLVTQMRQEFKEMHADNIESDRNLDKTVQSLTSNLQTQATLLTALVTRGGNGG